DNQRLTIRTIFPSNKSALDFSFHIAGFYYFILQSYTFLGELAKISATFLGELAKISATFLGELAKISATFLGELGF
ncbi:MAG: hypothetical protein J5980_00035, partial [Muribaculaceae bacterium]|nr:hypothetical protein [Muribaculaceae bacterium]